VLNDVTKWGLIVRVQYVHCHLITAVNFSKIRAAKTQISHLEKCSSTGHVYYPVCKMREFVFESYLTGNPTVNHSVGIAELRKVEVIRQNHPPAEGTPNDWKSRPSHSSTGKYLSPASNETPATSTVTVPTELLDSLYFSLILSYLRLSADASEFLFFGAPRASCSLSAGVFHTRGLNGRSLKLNVRCGG